MIEFLAEWTIRSSILIACGGLLLWALRTRDASIKLVAWTAMLAGSLAIPFLGAALPKLALPMPHTSMPQAVEAPPVMPELLVAPAHAELPQESRVAAQKAPAPLLSAEPQTPVAKTDWARAVAVLYVLVGGMMLLRVLVGLVVSLRLLRVSRPTELTGIRESDQVGSPVTLGVVRPVVVLPKDWREWDRMKLDAVLAHERSHIQRYDPAVQLVSAIHRALLWASPLSWFLHSRIVRTAEEASDDAAVMATRDRAAYSEVLLDFMRRRVWGPGVAGVPMARYGSPDHRIDRILDNTVLSRGLTRKSLAAVVALASPLAYIVATAQARPQFEIADVHSSPAALMWIGGVWRGGNPVMRTVLHGDRYELHQATMLDLIRTAYGVDADNVVGGPSWLDWDRFDVIAKIPGGASPESLKPMLQALLADRFKLAVHNDTRRVPGFELTAGQGTPKMTASGGVGKPGCQPIPEIGTPDQPALNYILSCRNITMEQFALSLYGRAGKPVVDATGIKGSWDFDIELTLLNQPASAGSKGVTIFDAVDKQLGLKLEAKTISLPVIAVDRVDQKPSANPAGVTTSLPPLYPDHFEVASIRPAGPDATGAPLSQWFLPGGRMNIRGAWLGQLIHLAWEIFPMEEIQGAPKWVGSGPGFAPEGVDTFDILAKATTTKPEPNSPPIETEDLFPMLRSLIIDRFKMKFHYEDRPVDAYALVAAKPKLAKADPSRRTGCKIARQTSKNPGVDPPLTVLSCQNITMTRFAEQLSVFADPYTHDRPVLDATGVQGAWDFTLTYGPKPGTFGRRGGGPSEPPAAGLASDPYGDTVLPDAIEKQLGLKLEMRKRSLPVFVIDHIEQPTEN
jgi:uncharacterized protein (TIGR03435 family)